MSKQPRCTDCKALIGVGRRRLCERCERKRRGLPPCECGIDDVTMKTCPAHKDQK